MVLVDSSVWIDHLRKADEELVHLLTNSRVLCHPFVVGELACGHLNRRNAFLSQLVELPPATVATHEEAMHFVELHRLAGRGIGWTDVHLLTSVALMSGSTLWTRDKRLATAASALRRLHRASLH